MHELSNTQIAALEAYLSGKSIPESARAAGVDPTTVRRWLRTDAIFQEALTAGRREALSRAMNVMADAMQTAVATVIKVMNNPKAHPHVRLSASKVVIESMLRWAEIDDQEERMRKIEEQLKGSLHER